MAAAMGTTHNRTYYLRMQTLLIDGGTPVLRHLFEEKKTLSPLSVCLQHYMKKILHVLNKSQKSVLFPSSGQPSSQDFDMSLLSCLLRNVCAFKNSKDPVWSNVPCQTDISVEADIVRLREARNEFAHSISTTVISEADFKRKWSEIEQILMRLNSGIQNGVQNLPGVLQSLKHTPLDTQTEARLMQEIKNWEDIDEAMKKDIAVVSQKLDDQHVLLRNISEGTEDGRRQSDRIERKVSHLTEKLEDLQISNSQNVPYTQTLLHKQDDISKNISEIKYDQSCLEKRFSQGQNKIEQDLQESKSEIHHVSAVVRSVRDKMELPTLSAEQKNLCAASQMFFEDAEAKKEVYVRTGVYEEARQKLQRSGLVILSGNPGEGKTLMATYLLLELSPVKKILRLSRPSDWRLVDVDIFNAIMIDDIFGSGILDEQLLAQWQNFLSEINLASEHKRLSVVITTRHCILKGAREIICRLELFRDDVITTLSSRKLTPKEKIKILENHLNKNGREIQTSSSEVEQHWKNSKGDCEPALMLGFPECAAMFASTEKLYLCGSRFFSSPVEFFQKCLSDISCNEAEFKTLVFVWSRESQELAIEELERRNIERLQDFEYDFEYQIVQNIKKVKQYLENHKDEFLIFNTKSGKYSFSHHVIGDVVGLVAAKRNPDAVIKYACKDFILRYVTTEKCHDDGRIIVQEFMYPKLMKKLCQLMFENEDAHANFTNYYEVRLKEEGIRNTRNYKSATTDRFVTKHDAFCNRLFIEHFVTSLEKNDEYKPISTPFVDVFDLFKAKYCIKFRYGEMGMCLPSLLLAKGNTLLVEEGLRQSVLTENEKKLSLLLATQGGDLNLVKKLIDHETKVNDDAVQIASVNQHLDILKLLLQSKTDGESHIQNRNSPLITATKRGYLDVVRCLLVNGVDVNYRNQSQVSALDKAIYGNHFDICLELLHHGARVNEKGGKFDRTPLHTAVDMGSTDIVKLMLESGADVCTQDYRGEYPVHSAAIEGHVGILRLLLEHNSSQGNMKMNFRGKEKLQQITLYHYAVLTDNKYLLGLLKEFNINPNQQDRYGRTPLYCAAFYGKKSFVKLLLDVSDLEKAEKNGYTPLHAAVHKHHLQIIKLLCQRVNVNQADKRGYTPLHLACKAAHFDTICALLTRANLDVRMKTKKGETVFHLLKTASENSSQEIVAKCVKEIFNKDKSFRSVLEELEKRHEIVPILQTISTFGIESST